ncbi:MAG: hypothetical protein JXR13_15060 [Thalassovita sp.]
MRRIFLPMVLSFVSVESATAKISSHQDCVSYLNDFYDLSAVFQNRLEAAQLALPRATPADPEATAIRRAYTKENKELAGEFTIFALEYIDHISELCEHIRN